MKKNIIALSLAAMLTITTVPAAVFAAGNGTSAASSSETSQAASSETSSTQASAENTAAHVSGSVSDPSDASAGDLLSAGKYEKDTLLVVFDDDKSNSSIKKVIDSQDADCEKITKMSSDQKIAQVTISDSDTMKSAINDFQKKSSVKYVQPNYKYTVSKTDTFLASTLSATASYAYYIDDVNARDAWSIIESDSSHATTEVSVLDTGVDTEHADLQQNLVYAGRKYPVYQEGRLSYSDDDNVAGYDSNGHGTHVTGIIGATYNNGKGTAGVASGDGSLVKVRNVGIFIDDNAYSIDIIKAYNYVEKTDTRVVNMSLGSSIKDYAIQDEIQDAYYNHDILTVAASGNENVESVGSPTSVSETLCVNATNRKSTSGTATDADYSNYGMNTDIAAPGTNIMSTYPGSYVLMSGTSMASPVVSAAAALVLDENPDLTAAQVSNILCATTGQNGYNTDSKKSAFGEVDCEAAVEAARDASTTGSISSIKKKASSVTLNKDEDAMLDYVTYPASTLVSGSDVTWTTSNPSVVSLEEINGKKTGRVIGEKAGTAVVTLTEKGVSTSWTVTVRDSSDPAAISLSFTTSRDHFFTGDTIIYTAAALDSYGNTLTSDIETSSSNESVAFASGSVLMCLSPGTATITAKVHNGTLSTSKTITVYNRPKSIHITRYRKKLMPGESYTFKAKVKGSWGNGKKGLLKPTWRSSNKSVATVNSRTGKVTARKTGTCYITADSNYGTVTRSIKLRVVKSSYSSSSYNLRKRSATQTSISLRWNRIPAAYGYILQRSYNGGKYKTIKKLDASKRRYTDKGLRAGRKYRYRVRAYYDKASGGRKYFSWSRSVTIRTEM